ncbi:tyrosine-type recombinase/integrase [Nonomuraea phyllanthi]|uniref:tyrosine-type recombinase/integrase n=1 Tax=Nonomuraea phyllanthi TaxID=2219224 RepID=UPI0037CC08B6
MYYSALRPAEAVDLTLDEIDLPEAGTGGEWGWLFPGDSAPAVGSDWTGNGKRRESRELKHRARHAIRKVPIPPPLVALLRHHLAEHGVSQDGLLFVGKRGGPLSESVYGRLWQKARASALSTAGAASPLAERPYDLRHACVSTWLNAGVPAPQVAERAGHSVHVLLRVYAKCLVGQDAVARQLIVDALVSRREADCRRRVYDASTRRAPLMTMSSRTERKRPFTAFPLVKGLFLLVWQVQGSNLHRLNRRFYSA